MKATVRNRFMIILIILSLFLSGCHDSGSRQGDDEYHLVDNSPNDAEEYSGWAEITEEGVDEELLINNVDKDILTYVAAQLQSICSEINEKGKQDKYYWLTGQWYSNALGSRQYDSVVALNEKAMKPLFLIIYESPNAGMYEWICCKALEQITGYDFTDENNGVGWKNSREFLKMFINRVLESDRNDSASKH